MTPGSNKPKRTDRVGEQIRAELMDLVLRGEVRDPRVTGLHIANVAMTADLRQAKVQVRLATESAPSEEHKRELLAALRQASGHLRRLLGPRLNLRYIPELRFFWDEGGDHAVRIHALLAEIEEPSEAKE